MNKERLNEVITYLKENPETHHQATWTNLPQGGRVKKENEVTINCGTTGCLAGHGAFRYAPPYTIFYNETLQIPNRDLTDYEVYGAEVFELSSSEVNYLFDADRTLEEIDAFVNDSEVYNRIQSKTCHCCD